MSSVPGQEHVLTPLLAAAQKGRLTGCYVFEGPEGVGKKEAARFIARAAACENELPESRPCDQCPTCHHMRKGTHPDLVEIGPDADKKTLTISVKSAREVIRQIQLHRYAARRRTFIIDPADKMQPQAANALLKTLEEPPDGTGFILVTHRASSLLPTVLSRSQRVRFRMLALPTLTQNLEAQGLVDTARLARLADGRPGWAQALLDGELEALDEARSELLEILAASPKELFDFSKKLRGKGGRISWQAKVERYFDVIESLLRDATCHAAGRPDYLNSDRVDVIEAWAQALYPHGIGRLQDELKKARGRLELNVTARLLMEPLMAKLANELGKARLIS